MTDAARTAEWGEDAVEAVARALCSAAGMNPDEMDKFDHDPATPWVATWTIFADDARDLLSALTPLVQAREAAAEMRGREDARNAADEQGSWGTAFETRKRILGAIDELRLPAGASALDAAVQRAVAAAYEDAAKVIDCGCHPGKRAEVLAAKGANSLARWDACGEANCACLDAAAIRARAAEGGGQ